MISRLQQRIMELRYTQTEVAKRAGLSSPRLSDYIHGTRTIPPRHLLILCRVLHCNPTDILGYDEFEDIQR